MSNKKQLQKLELTWIGKGEEPKLEPRILIENPEYSYGDPNSPNMLIHGDNLLALKALEQDYAGKVKCIYIDPPYNTGNAFEHYDDNLEHSIWLNLMHQRIKILYTLLSKDGAFCMHLDDQEVHYAKVLCDEIFGRSNFVATVAVKSSTPSGVKTAHRNKKIIKQKDLMLVYKKSDALTINPQYIKREDWDSHYSLYLTTKNGINTLKPLAEELYESGVFPEKISVKNLDINNASFKKFYIKHKEKICRLQSHKNDEAKKFSLSKPNEIVEFQSKDGKKVDLYYNGQVVTPLAQGFQTVVWSREISEDLGMLLCDFWLDIDFQNTQNEGGVAFPNSKKPESMVFRVFSMFSNDDDLVLDSFLGSGTTAAVAHKMGRRWIGVELGEHAKTHCFPRLQHVVDGEQGGISKAVNWQGGGGFKFYTLAPSLLKQDKFGNWVISQEYNADMLAAAMAKQEGFKYQPHESTYWKQGQSSEQDFIFTTTQFLTVEALDSIRDEMQPGETLLICCKSFQKECKGKFGNITIKKIPQMLLGRCEYGKEDYSLNIINLPIDRENDSDDEEPNISVQAINDSIKQNDQPTLF